MALRQHVELLILRQELHLHGPRFYAQTKSPKEGGSSLHTFPPHRPWKRFSFRGQNSKIRAPVGKVGLATRVVPLVAHFEAFDEVRPIRAGRNYCPTGGRPSLFTFAQ